MMMPYTVLLAIILGMSLAIFTVLWWRLKYRFKAGSTQDPAVWPRVSIIIPCRNEAQNLPSCLTALSKLDYPNTQIELVLGDDQSTDHTLALLQAFSANHFGTVKVISINAGDLTRRNGKTNALMQLVAASSGELLLFTDADCVVPSTWAKSMVRASLNAQIGLVTGVTGMKSQHWLGRQQGIDWLFILGIVKVLDDLGFHVTSLGNNMLISRAAYEAAGGYEALSFTLTEDFEMARSIQKAGFSAFHLVSAENHLFTQPELHPLRMLLQRKRWIGGFMQLNPIWIIGLSFRLLLPAALLYLALYFPWWALGLWLLHLFLQASIIRLMFQKTKSQVAEVELWLFEFYFLSNSLLSVFLYLWPSKVPWKDRKY